jgi:hypothetical protein
MTTLAMEPRLERFVLAATDEGAASVWAIDGSVRKVSTLQAAGRPFISAATFPPVFAHGQARPARSHLAHHLQNVCPTHACSRCCSGACPMHLLP